MNIHVCSLICAEVDTFMSAGKHGENVHTFTVTGSRLATGQENRPGPGGTVSRTIRGTLKFRLKLLPLDSCGLQRGTAWQAMLSGCPGPASPYKILGQNYIFKKLKKNIKYLKKKKHFFGNLFLSTNTSRIFTHSIRRCCWFRNMQQQPLNGFQETFVWS